MSDECLSWFIQQNSRALLCRVLHSRTWCLLGGNFVIMALYCTALSKQTSIYLSIHLSIFLPSSIARIPAFYALRISSINYLKQSTCASTADNHETRPLPRTTSTITAVTHQHKRYWTATATTSITLSKHIHYHHFIKPQSPPPPLHQTTTNTI